MGSNTTNFQIPASVTSVGILLTDDAEIRKLNKHFRKLDKTTDVLSFPLLDPKTNWRDSRRESEILHDLGEIAISIPMVEKQAKRFKCSFNRELLRLVIHGCLHLFGYDHVKVSAKRAQRMRRLEEALIRKYG